MRRPSFNTFESDQWNKSSTNVIRIKSAIVVVIKSTFKGLHKLKITGILVLSL
jgi:hypothetical protein